MISEELFYTDQHEWARVEGAVATVGISDFAQDALGDVTFVELPNIGADLAKGDEACAIESAKAAASIYAPLTGKVTEVNAQLEDDPGLINSDPFGQGWIYKIELADPDQVAALMDATKYEEFLAGQGDH
ncbi:MAG: glycine cleavage system protein GcvH [Phycisphaerae bacterium]|jgi:glycine cleavage system H protein|nr:glycine cleavage system protein GcvH [Phycisphaerae bacterium]